MSRADKTHTETDMKTVVGMNVAAALFFASTY